MALRTAFTELFSVRHPIALAPMGGSAGGALAAAVSNAGGLGLVGGGRGEPEWLKRECALASARTRSPWGIGLLTWAIGPDVVAHALEYRPSALMLSFGDPAPHAERVHAAGTLLIVQVTDLEEARRALDAGADAIVAQGTEAGGHGHSGGRSTLPFVPIVADLAAPVPVLAAGGVADGRGLAAALVLGAAGALIGTRFQASAESLAPAAVSSALIEGRGAGTERTRVLDIARDGGWPERYTARVLRNRFTEEWRDREEELRGDESARGEYRAAFERGDIDAVPVWASEAVDLITELRPAAELVASIAAEAEGAILGAAARVDGRASRGAGRGEQTVVRE